MSIANNHIFDFAEPGLLDTVAALEEARIPFVGAGATLADASRPALLTAAGARVAFLAAFGSQGATERDPGVLPLKPDLLRPLVARARAAADYVVLSAHWGMEFDPRVMRIHRELAFEFADMGVDLVLGHGAHVFQGIERLGRTLVFYGLGNFLFDHDEPLSRHGAVAHVTLHPEDAPAYRLTPFRIGGDYALTLDSTPPPHGTVLTTDDAADAASDRDFLKAVLLSKLRKGPIQGPLAVLRGLRHAPASYYRMLVRLMTRRVRK